MSMIEAQKVNKQPSFRDLWVHTRQMKRLTKILSFGLGIILISWLVSQLDISATLHSLRNVPISLILLSFLFYTIGFGLRALRFRLLLPTQQPLHHLFPIVLVHYTALNIIPARLGELSYIYLLKKVNNVSTGRSVSNLVLARVFDLMTISLLFLGALFFLNLSSQWLKAIGVIVGAFLIMALILLIIVLIYQERCIRIIKKLVSKFGFAHYAITTKILHTIEEISEAFTEIHVKEKAGKVLGVSLLIWISIFSSNYAALLAFQVDLTFMEVVLSSTCIILLKILPIQIMSGFGIHETTWVLIALELGVSKNVAITAAFGTHVIATIYLCILGGYGLWKIKAFLEKQERALKPAEVEKF